MYNMFIIDSFFEWDEHKNVANQKKHGVSFEEARSVFLDESAAEAFDPDHSQREDRFILVGISNRLRVLVICYCYYQSRSKIRIISARKTNAKEEEIYWRVIR